MIIEDWAAVARELLAGGHETTAALLKHSEPHEAGRLPSGDLLVELRFHYQTLLEKWERGQHGLYLQQNLARSLGVGVTVVTKWSGGQPFVPPAPSMQGSRTQSLRRPQVSVKERERTAGPPRADGGEMRLQAAWLSARLASEAAACLLGATPGSEMQAAADLYEMSVQAELLAFRVMVRGKQLAQRMRSAAGERDPRRSFSEEERRLLHQAAGGLCEGCGVSLGERWHADHRYPHSRGGPTALTNGAALCADCNQRKGTGLLTADDLRSREPVPEDAPDGWEEIWLEENPGKTLADCRRAAERIRREGDESIAERLLMETPMRREDQS